MLKHDFDKLKVIRELLKDRNSFASLDFSPRREGGPSISNFINQ